MNLKLILEKHQKWLSDESGGERADLTGADLTYANLTDAILTDAILTNANLANAYLTGAILTGAILRSADLTGADLTNANFTDAILRNAILRSANLTGADLTGANLTRTDLTRTDLTSANLTSANLTRANLTDANFTGADFMGATPKVDNLCAKIFAAVKSAPELFDMGQWHANTSCGTAHCLAGWAVHLAGEEGYALEEKTSTAVAGAAIFFASEGVVPNFYSKNDEALGWLKEHAQR